MLTKQQELFVLNLVKGMSQREAYRKAYPKSQKWQDKSVDSRASVLLKNAKVLERYNEMMQKAIKPLADDAVSVRRMIVETQLAIVGANLGDLISLERNRNGGLSAKAKPQDSIDKFDMRAVKGIRYDKTGRLIVELHDKQAAITCLREMYGLMERGEKDEIKIILQNAEEYAG